VYALATGSDVIWAGTSYGAHRIDPRTGDYISYEQLGPIRVILPIEDGQVWASGNNGIFFFNGQQWQQVTSTRGSYYYATLGIDSRGDLWAQGTDIRSLMIFRVHGHTPVTDNAPSDSPYSPPSWRPNDCTAWTAFYGTNYSHRSALECQQLNAAKPAKMRSDWPFSLATIDQDGSVWWVDNLTLQHRTADAKTKLELPVEQVNMVTPDPTRGVWLGTDQGLLYSDGSSVRSVSMGLEGHTLHDRPRNIAIDTQGNVWIVTAQGVQMLPAHRSAWQDVTDFSLDAYGNDLPMGTIAPAREGGIWATHGWDLWRFGGSSITPPIAAPRDPHCGLAHLTTDREGNVWTPSGSGACVFVPAANQWIDYPLNVENMGIDDILIGGDGVIYARASNDQLLKFTGALSQSTKTVSSTWQFIEGNIRDERIALGTDAQGGLWTMTTQTRDVWREHAGTETAFGRIIPGNLWPEYWYFDSRSWVWLYDYADLLLYNGQTWQPARQPDVGPIRDMASDPDGRVWLVGDHGVAVYDPSHAATP
jgi:ligand-binding sensor domain-containing protein